MPDHDLFDRPTRRPTGRTGVARRRGATISAAMLDRYVLTALAHASSPLSAYDLADRLRDAGHRVVAMSVYRALNRLCACDRVQKVEMLSAYRIKNVAQPVLLLCVRCGATRSVSAPDVHEALASALVLHGFTPRRVALEVAGLCADCMAGGTQ